MAGNADIVITGRGIVCGGGATVEDVWDTLVSGKTAVVPYEQWDREGWPVRHAAEVKQTKRELVPNRKLHKSISRTDFFGLYAGDRAIEDSGLGTFRDGLPEDERARFEDRSGIIAGSGGGNYHANYDFLVTIAETGGALPDFGRELGNTVTPMWLLRGLPNNVLCHVGINHQLKGTNACITNQCAGGILAVSEAMNSLRMAEADRIVAIGHDAPFEPENVLYYHRMGLMDDGPPRPFDAARRGTAFGEGAGALVLETAESAGNRGADIQGRVLGAGCVTEGTGVVDLRGDGDGVRRAIELALEDAGLSPSGVALICAHANGTKASDASEAAGIRAVFGESIPPATGFKWAVGHTIAASGIIDVVMTVEALRRKQIPGVGTLQQVDETLAPFPVSSEVRSLEGEAAVVICRGFGGMNVALVLGAA